MATLQPYPSTALLPSQSVGVVLAPEHAADIFGHHCDINYFEIRAGDYMGGGGPPHRLLERIRADYPITLHDLGLSVGSDEPLDGTYLARLRRLIQRYRPVLISTPLAWAAHDGIFLNAALPLRHDRETLERVCDNVSRAQHALDMQVLLENPASYLAFEGSRIGEAAFLYAVIERTGCGLALDIANVCISAVNLGFEAMDYIDQFPIEHVRQITLAGYSKEIDDDGGPLLIDDQASPVPESVWAIYRRLMGRVGPVATLIKRQSNVPTLAALISEVDAAKQALRRVARLPVHRPSAIKHPPGMSP